MKTYIKDNEDVLTFNSPDDFVENLKAGFKAAEDGMTVEIWNGGDYFTLEFHSNESKGEYKPEMGKAMFGEDPIASLDKLTIRRTNEQS